jgi:hypothetical protein
MRSTKQLHIEEDINNTQQQEKQPKLNLEKVMVRNLVKVKSRIRAGVRNGECGTCHCVTA